MNAERRAYYLYKRANAAQNRALSDWCSLPLNDSDANNKARKTYNKRRDTTERRYAEWRVESQAAIDRIIASLTGNA